MTLYTTKDVKITTQESQDVLVAQVTRAEVPELLMVSEREVNVSDVQRLTASPVYEKRYHIDLKNLVLTFTNKRLSLGYFEMFCTEFWGKGPKDYPWLFL